MSMPDVPKDHFERNGKLYGIAPFAHCDTDCPYQGGDCTEYCSGLSIDQRPCLKEDYRDQEKIGKPRITDKDEAERIVKEVEELLKKGKSLTERQKYEYAFAKIFLDELKKKKQVKK